MYEIRRASNGGAYRPPGKTEIKETEIKKMKPPVPISIYDSEIDRPKVKIILEPPYRTSNHFTVDRGIGTTFRCKGIVQAADEALACFFLYGGYGEESYMGELAKFVKLLNEILNSKDLGVCYLSGTPRAWVRKRKD